MTKEDDFINNIEALSLDLKSDLAEKLVHIAPETLSDGKIDFQKLKELLSDDVSEEAERFGLFWPGKKKAIRAAQSQTTATLKPMKSESKDWDKTGNVFIEGDNLEVLKVLQKHYHNKIKMIYIDPPYNTGKDFVYADNYREGLQSYLKYTDQSDESGKRITTNAETSGRYHSNWLNMMYPRLKLARNLLTEDGLIFVSIDSHEYDNLLKIMNEIFGENNQVNTFVWLNNLKGRQISSFGAAQTYEYVICFARNISNVKEFRNNGKQLKKQMPSSYKGFDYTVKSDVKGEYVLKNELFNTNSAFNEETRPNLVYNIHYNPKTLEVKISAVSEEVVYPGFIKIEPHKNNNGRNIYHAWRWSAKKVLSESEDLEFVVKGDDAKIFTKVRDHDSTVLKDIITDISTTAGSADVSKLMDPRFFDYPKPTALIKIFASVATSKDDIIMDFFAGSGTTAHAVMSLNAQDGQKRRHLQVQLPEPLEQGSEAYKNGFRTIADIAKERIRRAGEDIKKADKNLGLDTGFRVYKLADTNFTRWQTSSEITPDALQQEILDLRNSADDNASQEDLLTEIILKLGLSLSAQVTDHNNAELKYWLLEKEGIIACLDEHTKPTLDQLRSITDIKPSRFVILEDAFQGDDELKTNLSQMCKTKKIELWTV